MQFILLTHPEVILIKYQMFCKIYVHVAWPKDSLI